MAEPTSEWHRGAGELAERSAHPYCREGETWLWMCKTSVMDCCQHLIVINSKRSRVHGAISDTSGKDGVWVALSAIKGD